MARPLKIGLDLDGVFCDFNPAFADELRKTGRDLVPRPFTPTTWVWWKPLGYRQSESDAAWKAVDADPLWWVKLRTMHPQATTIRFFKTLTDLVHRHLVDAVFMTSRPSPNAHWQSVEWLRQHGMTSPQVLIAEHAESKGQLAKILGLQAVLDDYPANLHAIRLHSPLTLPILVHAPYNVPDRELFPCVPSDPDAYLILLQQWIYGGVSGVGAERPSFTDPASQPAVPAGALTPPPGDE